MQHYAHESSLQELGSDNRQAVSITDLKEGDKILLHRQEGARHTGLAIQETIVEK